MDDAKQEEFPQHQHKQQRQQQDSVAATGVPPPLEASAADGSPVAAKELSVSSTAPKLDVRAAESEAAGRAAPASLNVFPRAEGDRRYADLNCQELVQVVEAYTRRQFDEDIEVMHALAASTGELCARLSTSAEAGINSETAEDRRRIFASNRLPRNKPTPFWRLVWNASADFILRVLMLAGLLSLVLALAFGEDRSVEWVEGASIFLAVLIVVLVTAGNDYVKEKQFAALFAKERHYVSVLRDGKVSECDTEDIVVGDVLLLEAGGELPADCFVLAGSDFTCDESAVTGESQLCRKANLEECMREREAKRDEALRSKDKSRLHRAIRSPVCISGSNVSGGSGTVLVVAVGSESHAGKIYAKLAVQPSPTPLQNKLNALAADIGNAGLIAAICTLLAMLLSYWIGFKALKRGSPEEASFMKVLQQHIKFLVEAITIVVVAVPEGLPLAVTLSLAFSVGRMLKENNYVRRLAACETMGGANEICSDKTGTLTQNRMAVAVLWTGSRVVQGENMGTLPEEDFDKEQGSTGAQESSSFTQGATVFPTAQTTELFAEAVALNSTAYLHQPQIDPKGGAVALNIDKKQKAATAAGAKYVGSPTECALIEFLQKQMDINYEDVRQRRGKPSDIIRRFDFSSERKMMSTVVRHPTDRNLYRVYVKGAAEVVLRLCRHRIDSSGSVRPMDRYQVERLEKSVLESFTGRALRSLCLAYRDLDPRQEPEWNTMRPAPAGSSTGRRSSLMVPPREGEIEADACPLEGKLFYAAEVNLICLGIAGLRDPVRPEVPAAVLRCQDAGIKVRMVTGDNIETAKQIALACHVYHPERGGVALTGADFIKIIGGVVCSHCRTASCGCPTAASGDAPTKEDGAAAATAGCSPCSGRGSVKTTGEKATTAATSEKEPAVTSPSSKVREDVVADMTAFARLAPKLEVLARSQPTDKYALVLGLKALGSVVAVTGDGTNDAPALKMADVGLAMGLTGKETAKQAADIVLLDDNFDSIVRAVLWGRNIYDSIRKFLQFQLTVNVAAVITAFVSAVVLRQSPLSTVQMLWVNLIMDTLASLALATEPPEDKLLDRKPHKRNEYLVNRTMARNIIGQAFYQLCVLMALVFTGEYWLPEQKSSYDWARGVYESYSEFSPHGRFVTAGRAYRPFSSQEVYRAEWFREIGPSRHYTVVFNAFVLMQVFNLVNARKINGELNVFAGCLRSWMWGAIVLGILGCQALLVQLGGPALSCHKDGLTLVQWALCIAFGAGSLLVQVALRFIPADLAPEIGGQESDMLNAKSLALASRGRFSTGRLSSRLIAGSGNVRDSRTLLQLQQQQRVRQ